MENKNNMRDDLHLDNKILPDADTAQEEGWCSAEFTSGCILDDE